MYNREEAAKRAESWTRYGVGLCQAWTRTMFGAPSVGDVDSDGDADAVDGWKSEPEAYRHYGDRNPPRGVPVAFSGGGRGYGHRAVSLGNGKIRSTDMEGRFFKPGVVGTSTISDIERAMGVKYTGWSESISGTLIPVPKKKTRGKRVNRALRNLRNAKAKPGSRRAKLINEARETLKKIPRR